MSDQAERLIGRIIAAGKRRHKLKLPELRDGEGKIPEVFVRPLRLAERDEILNRYTKGEAGYLAEIAARCTEWEDGTAVFDTDDKIKLQQYAPASLLSRITAMAMAIAPVEEAEKN